MKRNEWILLCLLAGLVVFTRFWMLGSSPFTADTMEFYKYALRDQNIIEFWENPPWLNQIPLNETLSLLLVKAGLPATPFVVRLPFAIMGLFAAFFVWRFARRHFGTGAALFVLILTVFNPYALYHARSAYHYSGAICWSMALFSVFWIIKEHLQKKELPSYKVWGLWFVTAVLACHMHMCVWMVAGLQTLLILVFGWVAFEKDKKKRSGFLIPFFAWSALIGLLMSRWIIRALQEVIKNSVGGGHHIGADAKAEFLRLLPAYFAGENIFAIALLFVFISLAVLALFGVSDYTRRYRSLAWICVLHIAVVMGYVAAVGGGVAKITYFSAVWPNFMLFVGIGAYLGVRESCRSNRFVCTGLLSMLAGSYILLTVWPTYAIIHLEGTPTPFYKINDWVLKNLPAGTPILTDRWLEPWNELAVHNPGGINYTFTVPDEPLVTYRQFNWRETAEQFFEKYPEACFLELSRGRYEAELGKWNFPQSYFARYASITNEAALDLRRWKVFLVENSADAVTNRVITRIYYNTSEDLIAAARKNGREVLRLYGTGWGYAKPGWQQGRFEDYRILNQAASIDLYNLKEMSLSGALEISAATADKPKTVSVNGVTTGFASGRIRTWSVPLTLQPGKNTIPFASPSADPLFVLDIRWKPAQP
jgi:hypothetical protein